MVERAATAGLVIGLTMKFATGMGEREGYSMFGVEDEVQGTETTVEEGCYSIYWWP